MTSAKIKCECGRYLGMDEGWYNKCKKCREKKEYTNVINSLPKANVQVEFKTRWSKETLEGYYDDKNNFISDKRTFNCFLDIYEWRYRK